MILINDCQDDFKGVVKELDDIITKATDDNKGSPNELACIIVEQLGKCFTVDGEDSKEILKIVTGICIDKGIDFKVEEKFE